MAKVKREVKVIDINNIKVNVNQPRKIFDEESIKELAQSIKEVGIIQPLTLKQIGFNEYEIVSGERRYRASKEINLKSVPAIIIEANNETYEMISIIENIQRKDLNFFEEAMAYKKLMEEFSLTQGELALKVGKKQSSISNIIRLLSLAPEVVEIIIRNNLTQRHARALLKLPDSEMRLKAINEIARKDLNVRDSEILIEKLKQEVILNSNRKNVKTIFNYKIYTNTIKKAYDNIIRTGLDCDYKEAEYEDRIEVVITIPRSSK